MAWHWLDYLIFAVIGLSVITGLFRGFVKELIALIVWVLAVWLAYHYSNLLDPFLRPYVQDKNIRLVIAFVAVLLSTLIAGGLVNAILSFILTRSGLSGTDRLLGMGFGFVRGIFIVSLIMLIVKITEVPHQEYSDQSRLYAKFDPVVNWMAFYVPEFISEVKKHEQRMNPDTQELGREAIALDKIKHFSDPHESTGPLKSS
ncbi:CvpA family protein [Legionella impletisoli]|uniref:Colicin V biosynthesis protein n=1 Tax=Legionella impletisoli TaxID=343510 RepID=A0A917JLN3_9GAMM|nr:CvpA family protein [Legionella impletisoli]GGI76103.1 colicin V biosynthesis protein [Legionella impletisoli]